jgi:hypothetical protein
VTADHRERAFEEAIERELLERGYAKGDPQDFDAERALMAADLFAFLTSPKPTIAASKVTPSARFRTSTRRSHSTGSPASSQAANPPSR